MLTRSDTPLTSTVAVIDTGFSDHRLLRWTCSLQRPPPVYASTTYRPWGRLDVDAFRLELQQSALCRAEVLTNDADALADLYSIANSPQLSIGYCLYGQPHGEIGRPILGSTTTVGVPSAAVDV